MDYFDKYIVDNYGIEIYLNDAINQMRNFVLDRSQSYVLDKNYGYDLVILDPPVHKLHSNVIVAIEDANEYYNWYRNVCEYAYKLTKDGGALYALHLQNGKSLHYTMNSIIEAGWNIRNLIVWEKKVSMIVHGALRKQYYGIIYAIKGNEPLVFNNLRIDHELPAGYKRKRKNGIYLTDVWDDIRELSSGFLARKEQLKYIDGSRVHYGQLPIALITRFILISTMPGAAILDPFAGTGTTGVVAKYLKRKCTLIEIDPKYTQLIRERLIWSDIVDKGMNEIKKYYRYTSNIDKIWGDD
ncbi:MAG: hypothetical protein KatS3mg083_095 [Candidatus Dojkabacteria bacterium]|nr:MAG: hypothetical protein KatS3mg083_095 [Candidatus Dojkabacteria bacterium]